MNVELLEQRILKDGKLLPGGILRIDNFLNHQMDPMLMQAMAKEWKRLFDGEGVNKILTIEASGIALAILVGLEFQCPVVFAKKSRSKNISESVYSTQIPSFTHGNTNTVVVSKEYLRPGDRVLMIDDFLATGAAFIGLKALVEQAVRRALDLNADAYSDWQDQLLRIEYSARRKVHIYIRIPVGMTIEEAQQAFCREIEVPYDESCTTPERFIYVTGRDEEAFRSPHWLEPLSEKELEERREAYLQRGLDVDGRPLKLGTDSTDSHGPDHPSVEESKEISVDLCRPCSTKATDRTRFIAEGVMKEKGLEHSDLGAAERRYTAADEGRGERRAAGADAPALAGREHPDAGRRFLQELH